MGAVFESEMGEKDLRKLTTTIAAALVILPVLLLSAPATAAPPAPDKWTVMVYVDADNNLEVFGEMNLQMLESVGSSADVNFVVLMDTYSGPASLLYVKKGGAEVIANWGEVNMGDPATMSAFIKAAKKAAPAEKYCFISWDHGAGWRGLNWDDTSTQQTGTSQFMDMNELRTAVEDGKVVFDIFAFDQCLMAQPEVAYQMAGYAQYLVFSEETIYGQGFPYDMIAADLEARPDMSGLDLSNVIVSDFSAYYDSLNWANDWTISAYDMASIGSLTAAVTHLASAQLNALGTYRSQFKNDLANTPSYYYPYYSDLKVYATNVYNDKAIGDKDVKLAAGEVISAVNGGVVLSMNSKHNCDSTGLSIYFPSYKSSYLGLKPAYEHVPFAIDTGWLVWLQAFCANK
jgi:hypothetical protein